MLALCSAPLQLLAQPPPGVVQFLSRRVVCLQLQCHGVSFCEIPVWHAGAAAAQLLSSKSLRRSNVVLAQAKGGSP